jgi:hypothetical protein
MTLLRATEVVGRDNVNVYPATISSGPLTLSDDDATTTVLFSPDVPDEAAVNGWRSSGADARFAALAAVPESFRVRVQAAVNDTWSATYPPVLQMWVGDQAATMTIYGEYGTDTSLQEAALSPLIGQGIGWWESGWIQTADYPDDSDLFLVPWLVGMNNQTARRNYPEGQDVADFTLYELIVETPGSSINGGPVAARRAFAEQ